MFFRPSTRDLLFEILDELTDIKGSILELKAKFGSMTKAEEQQVTDRIKKNVDQLNSISNPHFHKE